MLCVAGFDGYFKRLNPKWEEILGYSSQELLSQPYLEWVHPDDREMTLLQTQQLALGKETVTFENRYRCKDSSYKWLLWSASPVPSQYFFYAAVRDITERKNFEESLRKSEERYRSIVGMMEEGIVLQEADGTIQACNAAAERILGIAAAEMIGKTSLDACWQAIAADGSALPTEHHPLSITLQTGKPCTNVLVGIQKPESRFTWIQISCQPLFSPAETKPYAAVATFSDITERKQTEERLRLLESAIVNTNDAITISEFVTADSKSATEDGLGTLQIVYVNQAFTQMTGFCLEEVMGKPLPFLQRLTTNALGEQTLANDSQRDRAEQARIQAALQSWQPVKAELLTYRKNGSPFWVELNLVPLEDNRGRFAHWLGVQRDITERKLAEMKLNAHAKASAVVAELGQQALAGTDLSILMETAVSHVAQTLAVEFCQVLELMPGANAFCLLAGHGWQKDLVGYPVIGANERSQAGYTLLTGKPVIVEDLRVETRFSEAPWLHNHRIIAGLSVIIHRVQSSGISGQSHQSCASFLKQSIEKDYDLQALPSRPFGVLSAHTRRQRQFTEDDVHFLQSVANVLATAIERKQAEAALRESEERYALAVKGSNEGLWDWNLKTNDIYFSPRWKAMLGYQEDEIQERPNEWFDRVHPEDIERVRTALEAHLDGLISHFEKEYRILHASGTYRWMICRGLAVRDHQGKAYRMCGSQTDITDRKVAEEQLIYDAFHDALTGLPNRALFMDRLSQAIRRSANTRQAGHLQFRFAVLFLDLDRFKVVNDSLGHLVGDHLLVAIARRLERQLRPGDTVARLGGDEFAILLEDITDLNEVTNIADRLQKELKRPLYLNGHEVFITASMGIAFDRVNLAGYPYNWPGDLLRDADIAMYRAKALGKARYEVFNITMHTCAVFRLQLESDLRRALEQKEFCVHYQPIINLATSKIIGFEALVRLFHSERGLVSPADFIPVAEETGLIVPLGAWVLREACQQMRLWQKSFPDLMISVNLSARQFSQPDLLEQIQQILDETGLDACSLKLEITESVVMENAEDATVMLQKLKALGVQLSIDDFGTGYSSLSYLHHFPINTLKIDRSFVSRMEINGDTSEIVQAIVTLAHSLHMDVVAEGIETPQQLAQLRALHCEQGQGYLFSKPLDSEAAGQFLVTAGKS